MGDAIITVLLLTGMVAVILVRILRYDVGSQLQFDRDDVQEETGTLVYRYVRALFMHSSLCC